MATVIEPGKVAATPQRQLQLEIVGTRQFPSWLGEQKISLAFTTYQTGMLFFIGLQHDGNLSIFERSFNRCMGLFASPDAQTLYLSTLFQMWRFERATGCSQVHEGYDCLYIPQVSYTTGDIDIHDIAVEDDGRVVFVNTLFSCLATLSDRYNFVPLWRPPFISKLAAEDRCHLNGLAVENGKARYVTSICQTDANDGWREKRQDSGIVMDVQSNTIIAGGLSMPHSPRVYKGKLWILQSGTGEFGYIDLKSGKFEPVAFCPGYVRGLAFTGDFAIVAMSLSRHNKTFDDLPLKEKLASRDAESRCGLQIIDLRTGDVVHGLRITGMIQELYDVVVLPGITRPMSLGFKTDEIRRVISIANTSTC